MQVNTDVNITQINIDELKPYKNNPRINKDAIPLVANSIRDFGFKVPIVIDTNYEIIAGHTRLEAAKKLGLTTVPCIIASDLTPDQVKAYRLADNKVAEAAEWDIGLLNLELEGLSDFSMDDYGFDFNVEEDEPGAAKDDEFDIDQAIPETPYTQPGDLYYLGSHRLLCGDSTKSEDMHKLMKDEYADLLITDPPYNVDYHSTSAKVKMTIQNDNMPDDAFRQFLADAFKTADEVMKPGAAFYIWHADAKSYFFRGACMDIGWEIKQCLIWKKNSLVMGRQDYQWIHEPCLYGWKSGASHVWYTDRKQTTIMEFNKPLKNDIHPTMKPIPLFDYEIRNSSKGKDIILDSFGGSGTTIMACEQNGRQGRSLELDPKYADAIVKRYIALVKSTDNCYVERNGIKTPLSEIEDFKLC